MILEEDFATLFEKSLTGDLPQEGDIVTGRIVSISKDVIFVDFGHKQEGQIPVAEFKGMNGTLSVKVGDQVEAYLESLEGATGLPVLSKEKAQALKIWDTLQDIADKDGTVEGTVVAKVKGGLFVDIGVKAFLPASQIDARAPGNIDRLLGKKFKFKILKLNKRKGNIIVSRRALMDRNRDASRQEILENLSEGQKISGVVKNLTDYGAFIDLGVIDGLLHITDMSWGRVNHPSEILTVGQQVEVKILKIDAESGKVSLGLKQLSADPWAKVIEKYTVGSRIKGRVVNVAEFGAFVELESGIEGLVHVSEMSWSRKAKHPSKVVSVGDSVDLVVLGVDADARRISLGMKQVIENPWEAAAQKFPVGTRVKGPIRSITDFGLFVGLLEEVDGLVHLSDLSWVRPARPLTEIFKKGQEIEAVVLSVDRENDRFSLGVKQLQEDLWPRIRDIYTIGSRHEGKVNWVGEKGVSVDLGEGIEAFVEWDPSSPLSLEIGAPLSVIVHSLDEREKRLIVGPVIKK